MISAVSRRMMSGRPPRPRYTGMESSKKKMSNVTNPLTELLQYLSTPIFRDDEIAFQPTNSHLQFASRIFRDNYQTTGIHRIAKARFTDQVPDTGLPEIAFLGFSNVGKSSLINALFSECKSLKRRPRTSPIPGHTKSVEFFSVNDAFVLVDMPGYGDNEPRSFATTVQDYLGARRRLHTAFLLFNPEHGFRPHDTAIIKRLELLKIDYAFVMTKIDMFSNAVNLKTVLKMRQVRDSENCESAYSQPFLVSCKSFDGIGYLQAFIAHLCEQYK